MLRAAADAVEATRADDQGGVTAAHFAGAKPATLGGCERSIRGVGMTLDQPAAVVTFDSLLSHGQAIQPARVFGWRACLIDIDVHRHRRARPPCGEAGVDGHLRLG